MSERPEAARGGPERPESGAVVLGLFEPLAGIPPPPPPACPRSAAELARAVSETLARVAAWFPAGLLALLEDFEPQAAEDLAGLLAEVDRLGASRRYPEAAEVLSRYEREAGCLAESFGRPLTPAEVRP